MIAGLIAGAALSVASALLLLVIFPAHNRAVSRDLKEAEAAIRSLESFMSRIDETTFASKAFATKEEALQAARKIAQGGGLRSWLSRSLASRN